MIHERAGGRGQSRSEATELPALPKIWGRGCGGVKSAGVSQRVRETGRDESQSVPSPEKLFKTRDLELPIFEGSVPSCSPHSVGYTRTSVHPYFPFAKRYQRKIHSDERFRENPEPIQMKLKDIDLERALFSLPEKESCKKSLVKNDEKCHRVRWPDSRESIRRFARIA